jgi:uncharacterized caspase-like protein
MKYALIIGNNKYNDPKLAQLKTPAADSQALAKVLDDKTIGSFDEVTPLINQTETRIRRAISIFLTNKKPDDLVLLYFSGHGVLDDRGRLYLALRDTQVNLLKATSIPSSFIADEMDSCRSKRQILVLDCCHSGAFGRGTKGEQKAVTETTFEGSGFGRVVLTASDSTQYALEGDQVIKQTELSLFTHFLLEGLQTGAADTNNDGHISLDEWYDYTYGKVISETPRQVPHKWSYNQQGDMIIAKNPYVKKRVVELPAELLQALESSFVGIRESAVTELGKYLRSRDSEMVDLAVASLEKMKGDDSRRISSLAERLLAEFEQARAPAIKVTAPKSIPEVKPQTEDITGVSSMPPPITTSEIKPVAERLISRPEVEKAHKPVDQPLISQRLVFTPLFWLKWVGATVLVAAILNMWGNYLYNNDMFKPVPILFGVSAGLVSLMQWFLFPKELGSWWIAANVAAGIFMGLLFNFLAQNYDWWDKKDRLFTIWVIGNLALGVILMWNAQKKSKSAAGTRTAQREVENLDRPVDRLSTSQILGFEMSFWPKWIGTSVIAIVFSYIFYVYNKSESGNGTPLPVILFTVVAGSASLIQWAFFKNKLDYWWVAGNLAAGFVLGLLHNIIYRLNVDWWDTHLSILLTVWVSSNFALGPILIRKTLEKSTDLPVIIETGARQNIFLLLLSVFLIFSAVATLVLVRELSDLKNPSLFLYGIAAILTGVSFIRVKNVPRNFGFITLAIFMFLDGINVELFALNPNYPAIYLAPSGIMALVSGIFFISQRETWKNFGFIMLSGYLILTGIAGISGYIYFDAALTLLMVSIFFAVPAAIFFFLRKEQSQRV